MEEWRLITTWGAPPSFNMGLDEALLLNPDAPPTLRFYSWSPDTLSLGYFQKFDEVRGTDEAGAVVRRITGGGAIHHVKELTFSITCPLAHPIYAGPVGGSYERVHGVIATALKTLGVQAELRASQAVTSDLEGTGMCFHESTSLDLCWGGRKGVGSAQRRKGGRVLHHGSIKLGTSKLEGEIATLDESTQDVDCGSLAACLRDHLSKSFGISLTPSVPTAEEREEARILGTRFLDPAFLRRR